MVQAREAALPPEVAVKGKHHILDTLAAMVSGAALEPGRIAIEFARSQGGTEEAQVLSTPFLTTAVTAAMANGFLAHSDETDDSHAPSGTHPGCGIVPAALAMGERNAVSGRRLLNAVVLGGTTCARGSCTLWANGTRWRRNAGSAATASAGCLAPLRPRGPARRRARIKCGT